MFRKVPSSGLVRDRQSRWGVEIANLARLRSIRRRPSQITVYRLEEIPLVSCRLMSGTGKCKYDGDRS